MQFQDSKATGLQHGFAGMDLWALIVWLGVFGFTGYWVGMCLGYPRIGLAAGAIIGFYPAAMIGMAAHYGTGGTLLGLAGISLLIAVRFVPASHRVWLGLGYTALAVGFLLVQAVGKRH